MTTLYKYLLNASANASQKLFDSFQIFISITNLNCLKILFKSDFVFILQ